MSLSHRSLAGRPLGVPFRSALMKGLFGSIPNALLTLTILAVLISVIPRIVEWALLDSVWLPADYQTCVQADGACWAFIQTKFRLILFGRYPLEEQWRPILSLLIFFAAVAISADWRQWGRRHWTRIVLGIWFVTLAACGVLMAGGVLGLPRVPLTMWSGLPLTIMLASVGIFLAFWLSIFLALGRGSKLPVIRLFSTIYIEVIRGVPLISILFMAAVVLPIILPEGANPNKLLRAQLAFFLFFSAYMAEALRGGLQAIPKGQYEAAEALGLTYWQSTRRIIVPQALRITIPSMVNIFIAALKDTSLVVVISMHDLLGTTTASINDPAWLGLYLEAYLFTAAIYFCLCFAISSYSQRLERHLGSGKREG